MRTRQHRIALIYVVVPLTMLALSCVGGGDDYTKTGGGGYEQPYNPDNGQYTTSSDSGCSTTGRRR